MKLSLCQLLLMKPFGYGRYSQNKTEISKEFYQKMIHYLPSNVDEWRLEVGPEIKYKLKKEEVKALDFGNREGG